MKKNILIYLFLLMSAFYSGQNFQWAKSVGGTETDNGIGVVTDNSGNLYTLGKFKNTVDFDPNAGLFNLTSFGDDDICISKLDPSGNLIWAKQIGGALTEWPTKLVLDNFGNIYSTGYFWGTCDFDPGNATYNLTSNGKFDAFVSKLDSSGNFVWARNFGDTISDYGNSIAVDASGNLYATGSYSGTPDFDPGTSTYNLTSIKEDTYILKLDQFGNFIWAKSIGSANGCQALDMATDVLGGIYLTGDFFSTLDFDPGPSIYNLTSAGTLDNFILKLDSLGNFVWAKKMGGPGLEQTFSIITDNFGNTYTSGIFSGVSDLDPGPSTFTLSSAGMYDIFLLKLDINGNFIWAKKVGGAENDWSTSLALDLTGNIYMTGLYQLTADFDPGPLSYTLTSNGSTDVFILKLDSNGNFAWVKSMGSSVNDRGENITCDVNGNLYCAGSFYNTVDFDPGQSTFNLVSNGYHDAFLLKLGQTVNGIIENNSIDLLNIFPNPNNGAFTILIEHDIKNGELMLVNSIGQTVYRKRIDSGINSIKINELSNGLYECIFISDNRSIKCCRILVE